MQEKKKKKNGSPFLQRQYSLCFHCQRNLSRCYKEGIFFCFQGVVSSSVRVGAPNVMLKKGPERDILQMGFDDMSCDFAYASATSRPSHLILTGDTNWPKLQLISQIVDKLTKLKGLVKIAKTCKDSSISMDDFDIELDEMELVAVAAGYHYYTSITRQPARSLSPKGSGFMTEVLNGPDDLSREMLRMDKHVFHKLSDTLRQRGMLRDTAGVMIEEQLAIFLNIVGHNERNRVIQERFQHSGETISRHFNNVLKAIKSLSREFLQPPSLMTPSEILKSNRFFPYFEDCIGVIDGMHIPAHVPAKDQSRFRNRKGVLSQNVLVACTFDLQFIFVYPGWEGSAADSRVLRAVLSDPDQNFPQVPEGKYYLVDLGYDNMDGFMAPFEGVRYHLHEYRGANLLPRNAKELFNHRHASLSNAIRKSCNVLKERFPILKLAPQYAFHTQRDIVIAACVIHNHIRREEENDWLFNSIEGGMTEECDDQPDLQSAFSIHEQMASSRRDSIAAAMWNDFMNKWDEW